MQCQFPVITALFHISAMAESRFCISVVRFCISAVVFCILVVHFGTFGLHTEGDSVPFFDLCFAVQQGYCVHDLGVDRVHNWISLHLLLSAWEPMPCSLLSTIFELYRALKKRPEN